MIEFRTKYSGDSEKYKAPTGDGYMSEYNYKYFDDGSKELIITGKTNIYEAVQADKDSTDINLLVARFAAGDDSALNKIQGMYGDFTKLPDNWADWFAIMQEGENQFNSLPVDLREMFDYSPSQFFAGFGSDEFKAKIEKYAEKFKNDQFENEEVNQEV